MALGTNFEITLEIKNRYSRFEPFLLHFKPTFLKYFQRSYIPFFYTAVDSPRFNYFYLSQVSHQGFCGYSPALELLSNSVHNFSVTLAFLLIPATTSIRTNIASHLIVEEDCLIEIFITNMSCELSEKAFIACFLIVIELSIIQVDLVEISEV